jgi:hypothetical protein
MVHTDRNSPRGPLKRQARDDVWLIYYISSIPRKEERGRLSWCRNEGLDARSGIAKGGGSRVES